MQTESLNTYLVTGVAGFIGFHLTRAMLDAGHTVIGVDNVNDYYDVTLKEERLKILNDTASAIGSGRFTFVKCDIADAQHLSDIFLNHRPDIVIHLAAQAGVRYSIDHPEAYVQSNLVGFCNILECCRHHVVKHLLYASSSSVYGGNTKVPFSEHDPVDTPVSLYAATKKADELMAYSYAKLYSLPSTGLRFFTVYGPYCRPDMAIFMFTKSILAGEAIHVYNYGDMYRDFTYVDDVVSCILRMMDVPPKPDANDAPYKIYNIGNHTPEKLTDMIGMLEELLEKKAIRELMPMQSGDVYKTFADVTELKRDFDFEPATPLKEGLKRFVEWYRGYYG